MFGCMVFPCNGGQDDCPCPRPSYFNETNGTTDGTVPNKITQNRYVSIPGVFQTGGWDDGNTHPCIFLNSTYRPNEKIFFDSKITDFLIRLSNPDGTTVENLVQNISGNLTNTTNNLTLEVSNWAQVDTGYEANIEVRIDFDLILTDSGRVQVHLEHQADQVHIKEQEYFYDNRTKTAQITGVSLQENRPNIKYLSGISYYDKGSSFIVDVNDIDYLNAESYPLTQVKLSSDIFADVNLSGPDLLDWTRDWDNQNAGYYNDDYQITQDDLFYLGDTVLKARTSDWSDGPDVDSNIVSVAVNTYNQDSDELNEFFRSENMRQTSTYGVWDSQEDLRNYDNNKQAQVINGKLINPDQDFTNIDPNDQNRDYTNHDGTEFYRTFTDVTSSAHGNAYLEIQGISKTDLENSDVELWLFIPGKWTSECYVHTTELYNYATFDGDNDPLRLSDSEEQKIHISFGTLGLDDNHNELRMRLVINNKKPEQITVSW